MFDGTFSDIAILMLKRRQTASCHIEKKWEKNIPRVCELTCYISYVSSVDVFMGLLDSKCL